MQALRKEWTGKGFVWFTVISSAPGQQGYVTAEEENAYVKQVKASPTAVLLDPTGELGLSTRRRRHRTYSSLIRRAS